MPIKREWITRAEAAKRLGVSDSMITRYCRRGGPSRPSDGKVAWPEFRDWVRSNIIPERSGNFFHRQAARDPAAARSTPDNGFREHHPADDRAIEMLTPENQTAFFRLLRAMNLKERDAVAATLAVVYMLSTEDTGIECEIRDWSGLAPNTNVEAIDGELVDALEALGHDAP